MIITRFLVPNVVVAIHDVRGTLFVYRFHRGESDKAIRSVGEHVRKKYLTNSEAEKIVKHIRIVDKEGRQP